MERGRCRSHPILNMRREEIDDAVIVIEIINQEVEYIAVLTKRKMHMIFVSPNKVLPANPVILEILVDLTTLQSV